MGGSLLAQDRQGPIAFLHKKVGSPSPQIKEWEGELGREEQSWNGQYPMKGRQDSECLYTPRLRPQMGWVFLSPRWPLAYCPGCFPSWKLLILEEKKEARGGASCDIWKQSFPRLHLLLLLPLTTTALWPASDHGLFFPPPSFSFSMLFAQL